MKKVRWFEGATRAGCCGAALLLVTAAVQAAAPDSGAALVDKANQEGTVRVIVQLTAPKAFVESVGAAAALASVQEGVLERVAGASPVDEASVKRFELVPGMALAVDAAGLKQLLDDPAVFAVQEDIPVPPTLYESIPLIDANDAWSLGFTGGGQTVAILDTGVTKGHPFLSGKVVSEACYSTTGACGAGCTSTSFCPGGVSASTAVDSGLDCPAPTVAGCGHGTHVAGIAAGGPGTTSGGVTYGVARDARIIAVKIFSRFNAAYCQSIGYSTNDCALTYTSDQIRGLERVYALRNAYAIAAANMSLGGGRHFSTCDTDSRKAIIDAMRNAGIATVISSGNDGFADSTGAPGCISTAITVGSTTKTDVESSFSNAASWLDLLAPGSSICSSVNGWTQNCGTGFGFASGTSMAAPHVTGAWAVMKSKNGTASVSAVEAALENTGKPVNVGPVGNKPRIDLDNAANALAPGLNLGLNWDHCQQTWRYIGDVATWCYLEANQTWVRIDDEEGEESLIDATATNHWVGVNVSAISGTSFTVDHLRIFKY